MKNLFYIILTFFILSPALSNAGSAEKLFLLGNEAYNRSDYDSALTCYKKLEKIGNHSSTLYYNIGNTFFRMNDLALAILYYERAKKLSPADEDILMNIDLTRSKLTDRIQPLAKPLFIRTTDSIVYSMSGYIFGIAFLIFSWLSFVLFVFYMRSKRSVNRKMFFYSGISSFIILFILCWINISIYSRQNAENEAIIMNESEYIMSGPNPDSKELFLLHEGAKLQILDQVGDWSQIRLSNGDKGWIHSSAFVII